MNKRLLVFVIILALFLCGCTVNDPEVNTTGVKVDHADIYNPSFRDLDAYLIYVQNASYLPDNFVYYRDLESFGEFNSFICMPVHAASGTYLEYGLYSMIDANELEVSIQITYRYDYETWYGDTLQMSDTMADMRTHPSGQSGTVFRDGINYIYYSGILARVIWEINDLEFSLEIDGKFGTYPMDQKSTLVAQLLSADLEVASAVVSDLAAKLTK